MWFENRVEPSIITSSFIDLCDSHSSIQTDFPFPWEGSGPKIQLFKVTLSSIGKLLGRIS
jgi:hypothetical protein